MIPLLLCATALAQDPRTEAQGFLDLYNSLYVGMNTLAADAAWDAATDVSDLHQGRRTGAEQAYNTFVGDPKVLARTDALLAVGDQLDPLQVRQLEAIRFMAGAAPGHLPALLNARVAAEAAASAALDGFVFCFVPRAADGTCPEPRTANDIDHVLLESRDLDERLRVWNASKEVGVVLKPHLVELRRLRNEVARAMGYSSYFGYMASEYGMSADELMALLDAMIVDNRPVYDPLHGWATRTLASRYGAPPPPGDVPAHWYPNRWAQEWSGLVDGVDLDPYFEGRDPEWIVRTSESFYTSLGFPPLPASFYERSDLYPVPEGQDRRKNAHASAWHIDLGDDLRSLMSVEADAQWFFTSHHELGHIYYYVSYSRPEVPPVLRAGANRAFHEAVGELASLAAGQPAYLRRIGVLPKKAKLDGTQVLLNEALGGTVAFIPWSAGVMARFEYELYEKDLPPEQWQRRWWELAAQYQGVAPPDAARLDDPTLCDACTKTHIIDDPAGYYDYALATAIKHQLHDHIATDILKQDPRDCDYGGDAEVGAFLRGVLEKGATQDWRQVIREATGEDLSTRALVSYYAPLRAWLAREEKKARR
ncbi:M2 family metallopeptidase [Myxococcota bacterium]|nr:M2 family metallopeptidase [Myxococcota bacterium]